MMLAVAAVMVFGASAIVTGLMRRFALSHDVPNERSSHTQPTPRGGGIGIVVAFLGGLTALLVAGQIGLTLFAALTGGGLLVAGVGAIDDLRPVAASVRAAVHAVAAAWALLWLRGGDDLALTFVEWIALVWMINLFNFMDGIDGIAGVEAVFVGLAGALLLCDVDPAICAICFVLAAASGGFLLWNAPRARIFMGDVGSGFLGYILGVIALASVQAGAATHWTWVILIGVFGVDATFTLLRRIARGKRPAEAHRSHAYQHASRRWLSHVKVTLAVVVIDVVWLLPWAYVAHRELIAGPIAVALALLPLAVVASRLEAGHD